jgi:hypothetical protein
MRSLGRFVIAALLASTLGSVASAQDCAEVYFLDDFNSYASDADVTAAGWMIVETNAPVENAAFTITNPCGRANPPTLNGKASTGAFLISDSDCAGGNDVPGSGMSHDVWTPSFSTVGATAVWLHVALIAQLNDGGDAVFYVDVSTDDGATATTAFTRVSPGSRAFEPLSTITNADGYFGQLDLDLSALAANASSVRIRFRHFEPTDEWFIAIDDVRVDCQPAPSGGDCEVFATETFDAGLGSMTAVSKNGNSGTETWHTTDKGGRYVSGTVGGRNVNRIEQPGDGSPRFAMLESDADPDPVENEYLVTPVLDLTTFSEAYLHFDSETVISGDTQEVLLSLDGGVTYEAEPIFSYKGGGLFDGGEEPVYARRVFSVPAAAGQSNVAFAFHWAGQDDWWWAIDNVRVTGTTPTCNLRDCGLRSFAVSYDSGTNRVNGSWTLLPGDEQFRVLRGGDIIAELPATATSFVDSAPPAGGQGVSYVLETYTGGSKDADCPSNEISTFICPAGLFARADQDAMTVALSWSGATNIVGTGIEIVRNGETVATLPVDATSYSDAPSDLPEGALVALSYEIRIAAGDGKCAAIAAEVVVSTGNVAFADDFESYSTDFDLELAGWFVVEENTPVENALWTITNPGGRSNPPTYNGKASLGKFAISDSDAAGGNDVAGTGQSHDFWSPTFDLTGFTDAWLHLDTSVQMNDNGAVVFDIDVSTDGGLEWTNVFRRVAPCRRTGDPCGELGGVQDISPAADNSNSDGYHGRLDVDLSEYAGQNGVRFRLRQFEPNDDWWIAVDNVLVDDVAPLTGGALVVFAEDFSAGLGDMSALSLADPANSGTETWHTTDKGARYVPGTVGARGVNRIGHPDATPNFAILESGADPDPAENEWLLTPEIDATDLVAVYLHYASETVVSGAVQEVLVSIDGGRTFLPPLFSYTTGALVDPGEEPFYAERVHAVPEAAGQARVVFAFHWVGQNGHYWAIDDVQVSGTPAGGGRIPGDANSDGGVDISDGIHLLNYLFVDNSKELPCDGAFNQGSNGAILNWNGDAGVDLSDGISLFGWLFLGGDPHVLDTATDGTTCILLPDCETTCTP